MPVLILWVASACLVLTTTGLLLNRSWRWSLGLLALQYFAAFWLALAYWPLSLAATILVAGWMSVAALGMTHANIKEEPSSETSWPQGGLFRVFAASLVLLTVSALAGSLTSWLPEGPLPLIWGALVLTGLGFLHLGMSLHPLKVILGLLTVLLGFEMFYTIIENSILVASLLVVVTLGLALAGCYLLILGEQAA